MPKKRTPFVRLRQRTLSIARLLMQISTICLHGRARSLAVEVRGHQPADIRPSGRLCSEIGTDATSFGCVDVLTMRFVDSIRNFNLTAKMPDISNEITL
jgi:hypothetical protein